MLTSAGAAIPRLGVPQLGSAEDTHGIGSPCHRPAAPGSTGCPTTFPAGPNTGAAFDRELWAEIGEVLGREGRALNNLQLTPLFFFDPDMNLVRDPRWVRTPRRDTATSLTLQRLLRCLVGADLWREAAALTELLSLRQGRAQEVPGECPYLTGEVGSILIQATQESAAEPRYLRSVSACSSYFALFLAAFASLTPHISLASVASTMKVSPTTPTVVCLGRGKRPEFIQRWPTALTDVRHGRIQRRRLRHARRQLRHGLRPGRRRRLPLRYIQSRRLQP